MANFLGSVQILVAHDALDDVPQGGDETATIAVPSGKSALWFKTIVTMGNPALSTTGHVTLDPGKGDSGTGSPEEVTRQTIGEQFAPVIFEAPAGTYLVGNDGQDITVNVDNLGGPGGTLQDIEVTTFYLLVIT